MNQKIQAAVDFIKLGWALVPIPPNTKGPTNKGWNDLHNTIRTVDAATRHWSQNPDWNMGVLLSASNIVVLDIDHIENCRMLFDAIGLDYDELFDGAPRILGRPGRDKAIFRAPLGVDLGRRTISWPKPDDSTKTDTVIEFRAGAIQDVLPPSIHPDTKKPYQWVKDPFDSIPELPHQLLTIWTQWDTFKNQLIGACPWLKVEPVEQRSIPIKPRIADANFVSVIDAFNDAYDVESIIERFGYKRTRGGRYLSPFSSSGIAGVHVFKDQNRIFSHHASEPFDTAHSHDAFDMWCFFEHGNDIKKAVREAGAMLGIDKSSSFDDEESYNHGLSVFTNWTKQKSSESAELKIESSISTDLLTIPGVLQDVVDYYNSTAARPQPQFAVQTALAFGSVVMGRRWRTNWDNYSSLYFINVGKSGSGKEHPKTVIESLLEASNLTQLIGPSGYSSSSGVLSALIDQPNHICIIDELGRQFESAQKAGNSHKSDSHTMIMEVFGRLHGTVRSQAYSTLSMGKRREEGESKTVKNPALTLLAMTTPSTLYENLSSRFVSDGFLNRFIIVESFVGRQVGGRYRRIEASPRLTKWARACAEATGAHGDLSNVVNHQFAPEAVVVPFSHESEEYLTQIEQRCVDMMDSIEGEMEEMFIRTKEIIQRVALIVAVSCNSQTVELNHLKWAENYVWHYAQAIYKAIKGNVADNDFEGICKQVYAVIKAAGDYGRTDSELSKYSRRLRGLPPAKRKEVMDALSTDYMVKKLNIAQNKGGKPRTAWVATLSED